ncbi:MAG: cupin domain-containing protein [Marinicella sp.]
MKPVNPARLADQLNAMEFHDLGSFNEGSSGVFWSEASGWSPWELHPDCEELLHVIEGEMHLEVLSVDNDSKEEISVKSGEFITIPRGHWHRQKLLCKTKEFYLTPGQTMHSYSHDPRLD